MITIAQKREYINSKKIRKKESLRNNKKKASVKTEAKDMNYAN